MLGRAQGRIENTEDASASGSGRLRAATHHSFQVIMLRSDSHDGPGIAGICRLSGSAEV